MGVIYALLAHVVPSGLTAPLLALVSYGMVAGGPEAFVEGTFLVIMVFVVLMLLQLALALGLFIAGIVVWLRGNPGLTAGLWLGWLAGVNALFVVGCVIPTIAVGLHG